MSLAGQYRLHPGGRLSIAGSRPVIGAGRLGRLLAGQRGEAVVHTLGSVLTLCAHAQRHTAQLALRAAQQQTSLAADEETALLLRLETARDHLRIMVLDWPQRLGTAPSVKEVMATHWQWLKDCPVSLVTPAQAPTPDQATTQLVQLHSWLQAQPTSIAPLQCLSACQSISQHLHPPVHALDLLDRDPALQTINLRAIAQALRADPDFALRPLWQGACAETGVWTRLRDRRTVRGNTSAWTRLQARWDELLALAGHPADATLLSSGALALGGGEAIAWCEMARGLLLHWVQLDAQHGVVDYRVLAPTEWNFHPNGALAQALTQLEAADTASAWCLACAYDPCVQCVVEEVPHA